MRTAVGLAEPPEGRDKEMARLREMLWLRLMIGASREGSLNDHLISQFRSVGRDLSSTGARARRQGHYGWGRWLIEAGRQIKRFAREIEAVR